VHRLVFDAEALSHVDATGIHALSRLNESLRSQHITLVLARLKGPTHQVLEEAGFLEELGEDHVFPTVRAAVQAGESFQKG
jgi:sulfate permease, SulP family